jgi:hypothetical protein
MIESNIMVTRIDVRNMYQELYQTFNNLQKIYSTLPMNNKSAQKVNELYLIICTVLAPIINELPRDPDEDTLFKWFVDENRARYVLAHVKIERIHQ